RSVVEEPSAFASRRYHGQNTRCRPGSALTLVRDDSGICGGTLGLLGVHLRRGDRYAMDFHLLTDALQVLVVARHRARTDNVTDARCLHRRSTDADFVDIGETLH